MTTSTLEAPMELDVDVRAAVNAACARIAPAWPLDRAIAVNPYWGWTDRPMAEASAALGSIAGAPMVMPREWYRARRAEGALRDEDLLTARDIAGLRLTLGEMLQALEVDSSPLPRHPLVTALRDEMRDPSAASTWDHYVTTQIGRTCESFLDRGQAVWSANASQGLTALWRTLAGADAAPRLLLGERGIRDAIAELPESSEALIAEALSTLSVPRAARESYLVALLQHIGGWAAAFAHRRWDARLRGEDDNAIVDLLAIRLAWELVLYRTAQGTDITLRWTRARRDWQDAEAAVRERQRVDWVFQRAVELRYHDRLASALAHVPTALPTRFGPAAPATIRAQAVFCIDVRSEVFRRVLEEEDAELRTLGFAGFFGLPLTLESPSGAQRPQLPGLLSANVVVHDTAPGSTAAGASPRWRQLASEAPSTFSYVEATGLRAAWSLLREGFAPPAPMRDALGVSADAHTAPQIAQRTDGAPLTLAERAAMAAAALRGMSLTEGFARLVAFIGHGALLTNNPQAAALACGACGGQSGEINARVLASLCNDPEVRVALAAEGIVIPTHTRFVGGLHDTVTDDVLLFPEALVAESHEEDLAALQRSLAKAGRRARHERAPSLGLAINNSRELHEDVAARGRDWAEVRPEWGLARNAAFIAAPRERTRPLTLKGRAFLHEYDAALDPEYRVLETILTAPMVVAHWINLQYYASTVDPERFGSGDKTLHNVVGGGVGVYEGAGGDLRIGLAKQSVHNGTDWVHEPLRLAVFIEAPAAAMDAILERHPQVRALVDNEWLYLHQIDGVEGAVYRRERGGWLRIAGGH